MGRGACGRHYREGRAADATMNRHADEVDGKSEPGEDQCCGLQGVGGGFGILRRADRPSTAEDEDEKKLTLQLPLLMRMLAGSGDTCL